jgi:hypothetical protein
MADPQPQGATTPDIGSIVGSPDVGSLIGADDKSFAGLVSGLTGMQRQKVETDARLSRESDVQAAKDKALRERAFAQEGAAADDIPLKWDAEKEHKKWESNPLEGFGSVGGLFAMVASAFTKAPMENAINGMAGAINSIKAGDEAGYQRAYDSFKENVKLADQRFKTQHELYSDALSLATSNAAASSAKFHNAAVQFDDKKALLLYDHGMYPELYELINSRATAMENAKKYADESTQRTLQQHVLKQEYEEIDKSQLPPQLKEAKKLEAFNRVHSFGAMKTEQQEEMATWAWEHRNDNEGKGPTAEERADFYDQHFGKSADTQRRANEYIALKEQAWRDAHDGADALAEERAKWVSEAASFGHGAHSGTGAGGPPKNASQLKVAEMQEIKDEGAKDGKWQTLGDQEKEWKRRQSEPTLSPEDLHRFAQNFADTGDTSIFTNLGRGQQTAGNILAIRNEAYKLIEERGGKPADISMLNARFQGLKAAERAGATQEMKMGSAAYEAGLQANLATKLSEKFPRTKIVPFNSVLQSYEEKTSDPDVNSFAAASNTLVNSYVRAISPTGISTDLVRKHAYDMLNTALSDEAYKRVVDVLKQEMRLAVQSPKAFREHMEAEFRHDVDPSTPVPKDILAPTPLENKANNPNTIKYDKEGNRIKDGG